VENNQNKSNDHNNLITQQCSDDYCYDLTLVLAAVQKLTRVKGRKKAKQARIISRRDGEGDTSTQPTQTVTNIHR